MPTTPSAGPPQHPDAGSDRRTAPSSEAHLPSITATASRVPEITPWFWIAKGLSTALGEAASDFLVQALGPVPAVLIGFLAFVIALSIQFTRRRYIAWAYWLAVAMVGVFGTMAADVLHVGFGVPYAVSTALFAVVLAAVFVVWRLVEKSLSIHSITTARREVFYWLAVVGTFALGTAAGDLTATVLGLGYLGSAVLFAVVILVPAVAYGVFRANAVFTFWFAYVVTRPLGASIADWLGKPSDVGGVGVGSGIVSVALLVLLASVVAYLAVARPDVGGVRRKPGQVASENS